MGGWPVVDGTFNGTGLVFEELLATFRSRFGTSAIISSWVSADDKNSTANIIQVRTSTVAAGNSNSTRWAIFVIMRKNRDFKFYRYFNYWYTLHVFEAI